MEGVETRPMGVIPDILLDEDRLNMLLDIVCADYITACYASRENGKRVVLKALEKLYISVYARASEIGTDMIPRARPEQDPVFHERAHRFYTDVITEFRVRKQALDAVIDDNPISSVHGLEDSLVREVMKPKLLHLLQEICRDRDRHLAMHENAPLAAFVPTRAPFLDGTDTPFVPTTGEIRMEGWLRKKGQHVKLWRERYFMIRSTLDGTHFLCYVRKKGDKEPRGWYVLGPGTTVDQVRESPSKIETKKLFTFRLGHVNHVVPDESDDNGHLIDITPGFTPSRLGFNDVSFSPKNHSNPALYDIPLDPRSSTKRLTSRRFRHRAAAAAAAATAATAVVLTGGLAGVGIGVMGMSMSAAAAASAGAAGALMAQNRSKGPIALAAESFETAVWWRDSILECIAQAEEQWRRYLQWYLMDHDDLDRQEGAHPLLESHSTSQELMMIRSGSFGSMPRAIAKTFRTSATFSQETTWQLYAFSSTLRVDTERLSPLSSRYTSTVSIPALRTSIKVPASPRNVFEMLMNKESLFYTCNHVIQHARVVDEQVDDHSDVVYWKLFPTYLWPVYVSARDLCMLRYWRMEPDGSYFICFQSTTHSTCPRTSDAVRANVMGMGFIISPRVQEDSVHHFQECWVTLSIQMNPKGYLDSKLARLWYYVHAYGVYFLEIITAITAWKGQDTCRPITAALDCSRLSSDTKGALEAMEFITLERYRTNIRVLHGLPTKFWSEPSAETFLVRGPQYVPCKTKVPSARQAFRLVNVALYKSKDMIQHVGVSSIHTNDVDSMDMKTRDSVFFLIINFMVPGFLHHSLVLYFTPEDPMEMKENSVFANLCHEILRGSSDTFRTERIKLIPRVIQGSKLIRDGVGTTPAILGTKVYQKYYRGLNYMEIDYDIGSSTVASGILKLLMGYARELVIDLAFVIEAQSVMELPERVLGTVRLDCIDLQHAVPYPRMDSKKENENRVVY